MSGFGDTTGLNLIHDMNHKIKISDPAPLTQEGCDAVERVLALVMQEARANFQAAFPHLVVEAWD